MSGYGARIGSECGNGSASGEEITAGVKLGNGCGPCETVRDWKNRYCGTLLRSKMRSQKYTSLIGIGPVSLFSPCGDWQAVISVRQYYFNPALILRKSEA